MNLETIYNRSADPSESLAELLSAVADLFAPLSATESIATAREFGIVQTCRTKKQAVNLVSRRVSDRWESANRCRF
jgi:hypothetical protein